MRPFLLLLPFALVACQALDDGVSRTGGATPSGETRIVEAKATPSRMTLRMSDGARCVSERPEGVPGGWSGVTSDCGYQLPFTVAFKQQPKPQRFTIEAPIAPQGPRAEIFVTDLDGVRRLFVSPLGRGVRFGPVPAPAAQG
ncbi:hypothetical protein MWU52_02045 [Jannaschia sp. S6380]|uniref:hypothetical protein n=1 Tax=Jannaschia sp. S6380 TaxID=2926408 RepID=UPI001FF1A1B0|nr:hypothetical protein [Jannaschia sp. S6380]MCK0166324.1 hypothetical protein [Jannaschia sp. S6380]